MRANALAKGNRELAAIADEVLLERFPSTTARRTGGSTPTLARFRERSERFQTGKDAYIWLIKEFLAFRSTVLDEYAALHRKAKSTGSRFSKDPNALFPPDSPRAGDSAYFTDLDGGWFADTNLNHRDKFVALMQLAYLCKLDFPNDWTFDVEGATDELKKQQALVLKAKEILRRLLDAK